MNNTEHDIRRMVASYGIRNAVRLALTAPRMVLALLDVLDHERQYNGDQLRRRAADEAELRGRRSVEIEAAGREGYRQGDLIESRPLDLGLVYAAALAAKPTEVAGELKLVSRSRAGAP